MDVLMWAILIVVFVIVEIVTVQLVSIWFAAGALVTMICAYLFDIPIIWQLVIFIASSAVFTALTVPFIMLKRKKKGYIPTNSELEVGKSAVVIEDINTDNGTGRVKLNGVDWSAVPANGENIPKGSIVTITAVSGAKLTVTPKN